MMPKSRGHVLATVLFTDMVDSSKLATELGDRRWRVLLERHHAILRRALKRHGGREIDTAGDGFFAVFDDQVDAIRCACEASDGVKDLGIDIRAGLHVGQSEVIGKKVGGVVVHAGARIMSEAGPGDVLVSSVLRELVPGSGFTFVDRGTRRLKGIDGDWQLFAVTAVDGIPRPGPSGEAEAARARESIELPPLVERRSVRLGVLSLGALLAIGVGFFVLHKGEPPPAVAVLPNTLAKIDTTANEVGFDTPVAAPGLSQITAVPPDQVWVLSQEKQVISIVNTATGEVTSLGISVGEPSLTGGFGIVYAEGDVWVTGGLNQISEFSTNGTLVQKPLRIPDLMGPTRVAFLAQGYGRVWATSDNGHHIVAIDAGTGHRVGIATTPVTIVNGIGVGEGSVWVTDFTTGLVAKIDPHSLQTKHFTLGVRTPLEGGDGTFFEPGGLAAVATGFGSVWVSDVKLGLVYRVDPATDAVQARIYVGEPSLANWGDIIVAEGSVWVAGPKSKTIVRINPGTNTVQATIPVPYTPAGLAAAPGAIWVTVQS